MRFPSLFRLPRHQQFRIKPRYYDPVKEEIKDRTERIARRANSNAEDDYQPSTINFKRKAQAAPATSMLQLAIAATLCLMILGWFQFGNDVFYYLLWIIVPSYLFYRIKTLRRRK